MMNGTFPLSVYVHIPFCKRRCSYCSFTVFEKHKSSVSPADYVSFIKKEIQNKRVFFKNARIQTVYFGGGTPSAIPPELLLSVLQDIRNSFTVCERAEISMEINPGDITEESLKQYREQGVNRFSLGVQTFDSRFLKESGRTHGVKEALRDLSLFQKNRLNFSLDLMFGLPRQTLVDLKEDLEKALCFSPPHISLYNLTIPSRHPLCRGRVGEEEQVKMFRLIKKTLKKAGLKKYELSNFAKKGFYSRHNFAYWNGSSFLGLGVSAHSHLAGDFPGASKSSVFGWRFWNSSRIAGYIQQSARPCAHRPFDNLPANQAESLALHSALTDFCHTRLRTARGISVRELNRLFPKQSAKEVLIKLQKIKKQGLLRESPGRFVLTAKGEVLSNQVFLELTFLEKDILVA